MHYTICKLYSFPICCYWLCKFNSLFFNCCIFILKNMVATCIELECLIILSITINKKYFCLKDILLIAIVLGYNYGFKPRICILHQDSVLKGIKEYIHWILFPIGKCSPPWALAALFFQVVHPQSWIHRFSFVSNWEEMSEM